MTTQIISELVPRRAPFQVRLDGLADVLANTPPLSVNIDSYTARQSVCKWLFDEVATMLMGHMPQLVIERQRVYWRVPVVLTSQRGVLGEVGAVIVDAQSGDLSLPPDLANTLVSQAQALLTHDAPAAHFSSNAA